MSRILLTLLVVALSALLSASQNAQTTVSQLNLHAGEGQAAFVRFGMGKHQYSIGAKSTGFFIEHNDKDVMSISPHGHVTVRTEVFSAENIVAESFSLGGVKQWALAALETFGDQTPAKAGWFAGESANPTIKCSGLEILTGPTGAAKVPNLDSFSKHYEKLPKHNQVRIQATVHFIDDWQGETAYLKIDNHIVWTDSHDQRASRGQFNVCGNKHYPESKFTVPIDVTIPHRGSKLKISFGTTLDKTAIAQFGLSTLSLSLRSKHVPHHHKATNSTKHAKAKKAKL